MPDRGECEGTFPSLLCLMLGRLARSSEQPGFTLVLEPEALAVADLKDAKALLQELTS